MRTIESMPRTQEPSNENKQPITPYEEKALSVSALATRMLAAKGKEIEKEMTTIEKLSILMNKVKENLRPELSPNKVQETYNTANAGLNLLANSTLKAEETRRSEEFRKYFSSVIGYIEEHFGKNLNEKNQA
jgi:hypothetical protein